MCHWILRFAQNDRGLPQLIRHSPELKPLEERKQGRVIRRRKLQRFRVIRQIQIAFHRE